MKFSIITATWNSVATLRDTLESVLRQTYPDVEHIVVDGGSTDGTMELVREYEPRYNGRLRYVSEPDRGIYDAMNKGIGMATGDVVGLLNSDDFYTSDRVLERVAEVMERKKVDAVYGDVHYVRDGRLERCVRYYSSKPFRRGWMRLGFMPAHPSFYCRREVYMKYGGFDISYRVAADFENLLRLLLVHRIATRYIPMDFVTMRTGGASSSGMASHRQIMQDHLRALRSNGVRSNRFLLGLRYLYKIGEIIRTKMKYGMGRWRTLLLVCIACVPGMLQAQALRGTTGLLHMPTADMEKDKTVKIGGNVLDIHPLRYEEFDVRYTFNYYLNITFFPWLEIGYTHTLNYANEGSAYFPESSWGKYTNQDRSFYGRLRVWKEGWWKKWTPQIVLGVDDPGTHKGGKSSVTVGSREEVGGNAFFMRYYVAATKHFDFQNVGNLGVHVAYVKDSPACYPEAQGVAAGVNFRPRLPDSGSFIRKVINGFDLMAEYDVRSINVGGQYHVWKDHINVVAELNDGKYFSGGLYFKIWLK